MTTPTPKFCYHGNAVDCCDACDREETIGKLKSDLAAAQEANAQLVKERDLKDMDRMFQLEERAQRAEALAESEDELVRELRDQADEERQFEYPERAKLLDMAADALVALRAELDVFLKGEFICRKCGLRKDGEIE